MDSLVEAAQPGSPLAAQVMQPVQVLAHLRRYWLWLVLAAVVCAIGAYAFASTLTKSYTAEATVAVQDDRIGIAALAGALQAGNTPDPMPIVHTEVQALSARQLVAEVARQLHLDQDPEFNASLRPPTFFENVKNVIKSLLPAAPGGNNPAAQNDALINGVLKRLVITQDNRSMVIGIDFTAYNPVLAANFVNTLIKDYIEARIQRRNSADTGANAAMTQRIQQVRADIEDIERKMSALRDKSGSVALRAGSIGQQQVEDLTNAAAQATLERSQIEANWQRASALAAGGSSDALANVLGSETISRLRQEEIQASERVANLSQQFGPNYPEVRSAEADLAVARRGLAAETGRIVSSLATQLRVARQHEADVLAQLAAARREGVTAQNVQAQLDQLQQDAATRRDLYRTLLISAQQAEAQPVGAELPDVRILSHASVPGLPSSPNMKLAAGFGGVGGALVASMIVLGFTRGAESMPDAAAYARRAGLIPIATLRGRAARAGLSGRSAMPGQEIEELRLARTRLPDISRGTPRVVGFVGSQGGPVAALVASAYARLAAQDGRRVLLIDAAGGGPDGIGHAIGQAAGRLADLLNGDADWRDCVTPDGVAGLDMLTGQAPAALSQAQRTVALENLLVEARAEYDQIVLGAPSLAAPDAVPLARSADVTVVVVDERGLGEPAAEVACGRLRSASRSPLAAILLIGT
jgi:uncharacterized protein involved in exopolysaccharide biosynthesis/Mrp family chromosome partitioning ATPase